jgi:hypothetical protein
MTPFDYMYCRCSGARIIHIFIDISLFKHESQGMRILHSFFKDIYGDYGNVRFLGFFVYKLNLPFLCLGIYFPI